MKTEKLQKILASRGVGSRREMERWIQAGRVVVDGRVATLGQRVTEVEKIVVDGRELAARKSTPLRMLLMNKRVGTIVSTAPTDNLASVFDELPTLPGGRWISVGRLDVNTSGLLLFVNDGLLAHRLMHPSTGIDREYAVRVEGKLEEMGIQQLKNGVLIDGEIGRFSDLRYYNGQGSNHWYHVVLMEGRNREIRLLFASQGVKVTRLKRVRFGPVVLPSSLRRGQLMELRSDDVRRICDLLKVRFVRPDSNRSKKLNAGNSVLIPYPGLSAPKVDRN